MKYSLLEFLSEYEKNKVVIHSYLQGNTIENYTDTDTTTTAMFGLGVGVFVLLLIIMIAIWAWALWSLVTYWKILPDWAKVLGIIGILPIIPGGTIITLISVYIGKQQRR